MPVHYASMGLLEQKVAELEAAGEQVVSAFAANESACVIFTKADGRRRPRGVEIR